MFINKKNSIFYISCLITVVISLIAVYKYVIVLDYKVYMSIPCIDGSNQCFVSYADCENDSDTCMSELASDTDSHYLYAYIDAATIQRDCSGSNDVECVGLICANFPDSCEVVTCSEESVSEGETCI